MKSLISIIIPIFNHAQCIERSLFSISKQTYRPVEIIIVDDGSTDNLTLKLEEILRKDWTHDLFIKIFRQKNMGAATARNRGLVEAKGEYVIFWDADTIAAEEMLAKMVAALELQPEASYAYSQFKFGWKKMKSHAFDPARLKVINYIDTTSLIRHKDVIPFDEKLRRFQDWDLWLSMMEKGKSGVFIPEVLFKKEVGGRAGISNWLPSFLYRLPWKTNAVKKYEAARQAILQKHSI